MSVLGMKQLESWPLEWGLSIRIEQSIGVERQSDRRRCKKQNTVVLIAGSVRFAGVVDALKI